MKNFDPFSDRKARNIRNRLSETFMQALQTSSAEPYELTANELLQQYPEEKYQNYIIDRIKRFQIVFEAITQNDLHLTLAQSIILWNHQLFFEMHELLESIWQQTAGAEKQALKGLIQAAGVYVQLEADRLQSAKRLAKKAIILIETYSHCLINISNLDELLAALTVLDTLPPTLLQSEATDAS